MIRRMTRLASLLALAALAGCAAAGSTDATPSAGVQGGIWEVSATPRPVTPEELARRLGAADVVILGEVHDNAEHHARQAWLVSRLRPAGVAFEMVPEASEEGIGVFLADGGSPAEIGPAIGWDRLGWPDWDLYRPVFEAAEGAYIAGGGVERAAIRAAFSGGAAAAFGADAAAYGLDRALPGGEQTEAEAEMVAAHCDKLPASQAGPMVEAQRLRDARFAEAARRAMAAGGGMAVLITGNGHARTDRGVPLYLSAADDGLRVISLGQVERGDTTAPDPAEIASLPYDYVWFSDTVERGDPCAAFR